MTGAFVRRRSVEFAGGCAFAWHRPALRATQKFILRGANRSHHTVAR